MSTELKQLTDYWSNNLAIVGRCRRRNRTPYRVYDVLQGGRKGVDELVWELGQEADGVHVQNGHVTGQLAGVDGHVEGGEQLVPGLQAAVAGQSFDQSGFSWTDGGEKK